MPLPDYLDLVAGTPITWTSSGGDKVITLTSLADSAGREGDKSPTLVDVTLGLPAILDVRFEIQLNAAATNWKEVELWFGTSDSSVAGTDNPGNLTGADAAWTNASELRLQTDFVGALVLSNARGTNVQKQRFKFKPVLPYIIPGVYNVSGQAFSASGTNQKIVVTPYYRRLKD
jgi:hypothetical protein